MATQLASTSVHSNIESAQVYFRDLILLTFRLAVNPLDVNEAYTLTKNLAYRIKSKVAFEVPNFNIYERMVHKLLKQQLLLSENSKSKEKYSITLSEKAEGEVDFLLYSLFDQSYFASFEEFRKLSRFLV